MPPRKGRLETYLWDAGTTDSIYLANGFHNTDRPLAEFGPIIPIAADQDYGWISHAVGQYAAQDDAEPFTVVLHPNYELVKAGVDTRRTVDNIQRAQERYPDLDIRYDAMAFGEQRPIGSIRKEPWDAIVRLALADGIYDRPGGEFIGLNHDIDTVRIGRHYMRNVQRYYRDLQAEYDDIGRGEEPLPSRYTQVKHAFPFAAHPNIARAMLWNEFAYRQQYRAGGYEEGMVIPLSWYAIRGGFDETAKKYETRKLRPDNFKGISLTPFDTSPRRYISRLGSFGLEEIWAGNSFMNDRSCREPGRTWDDISLERLQDVILESFDRDFGRFIDAIPEETWKEVARDWLRASTRGTNDMALIRRVEALIEPRFRFARRMLQRIIGSEPLTALADDVYRKELSVKYALYLKQRAFDTDWVTI